ncbi:transmembrane protein, putative (macronuclear) [Tetrahymena thermophila SB210]|uniref:Transmembrane protein, putative n=1 Tax=Tetrahymena thermophila (strain SB210) TaxID=312017 RepID=Q23HD1_TETTS|nr:transmembrane protein, putative [Tetrahymena thermophila SB210]EAR95877.2 transmembrane protein, putative [Tetrahymena thermophila SB210]|eukprot:XP_001016122.2 transmembrane protein, putative [Tetrahymena thermophila SB210]
MQKLGRLLAITFCILYLIKGNQQINNCGIQQIVYSDPQHLNPYIICTECSQGYIVNYDFKSCIKATTLPLGIFQYCKRLDRNRQCDEALCTIQIDQNDLFVRENPYQYDPRCAKIDTINQICISPRFPYTLEIATNQIFHYANSFCKIQYYNGCRQNYETFYQSISNQLYFTLVNFINPDLIDQKTIYKEQIKCLPNFTYQQVSKQFIVEGCYPVSQTCSNVDINGFCKCPDDQAVDSTGSQCLAYQNCQIGYANNINQIKYCIQCKYGYIKQPYQADCTLRCIEDTANQICKYCYTGDQGQLYYGQFCDQVIVSRTDSNCQITNSSTGDCVKCNEQFFYSIIDKICKYRARSNGCQYLNPVSDQCLTLQCAQKYQLSDQLAQILWQKIPKNLNSQFSDPQNVILLKYYLNQYFAQPDTVKSGFFQISNNLIEIFSEKIDLTNLNLLSDIYYYNDIGTNICQPIYYNNQVPNCKTFFAGLCIECENSDVYYQQIGPANPVQTFLYVYNSFCGQSEDWYIPNCKVLSGDMSSCMVCKEGYIFNSSNQCVLGNILNCIFQDSQGNCVFCKQQYVLSNNKCYFISKNCAQYTFDDQKNVLCTACKDTNTFQLVQNTLQKVQSCQLLNPLVYQPCQFKVDGTCKQCDKGTTLNQQTYQCDINQDNPYYCQSPVGSNSNLCNQCQNGYILDKGICFPQSGSCSYYKPLSTSYQNICDYENPQNPQNQLCQFFNQQGQYLAYDQNYKIFVQKSCNITDSQNCFKCSLNMCLDTPDTCGVGKGWSKTFNQCFEQCLDDKLLIDLPQNPQKMCNYKRRCDISKNIISNMFQCSDCSLVKTIYECIPQQQNSVQCQNNYFFQKGQCMYNCGKGKISYDQSQCQYSQLCQEGLTWSYEYNQCVYKECNKNITAVNQSCLKQQKIQIIQSQLPNDYRFSKYYVGLAVILVFLVLLPIFYFVILKMATKLHQQTRTFIKQLRLVKNAQQMNNVQNSDKNIQTSFSYKQNSQDKIEVPLDEQNITGIIVQTSSNNIPSKQNIVEEAKNKQNQIEINIQMYTEQDQDVGSPSNLVQIQSHRRENSGSLFNQVENQS